MKNNIKKQYITLYHSYSCPLCNKKSLDLLYQLGQIKIVSQYSPRDEEVSLAELEKVGRAPMLALPTTQGCCINSKGFLATNIMLSSLSLANTGIPSLALLSHCCSSSDSVSHSLHMVAKGYKATN